MRPLAGAWGSQLRVGLGAVQDRNHFVGGGRCGDPLGTGAQPSVVCARRPGIVGEFGRASGEAALGAVGQPDVQERLLSAPAQRLTDKTMTDPESLRRVLIAMYERGVRGRGSGTSR
ncbi:hypothetical protein [Streptomyces sp. 8N616]|uniref:hypothetical protein n=1 Tax=Streptomyces sp. 8N616 TaxID=3457414 RepID=UPI003FCF5426